MAITVTNRVASNNNGGGASATTGSFTPGTNKLVLVSVFLYRSSGTINAPTVSGNGITYTEITHSGTFSQGSDPCQTYLFRGMSGSPSAGGISISSTGAEWIGWSVDEADGIDTSGTNGSGAIVQSAVNQTNSGGSLTVTLAAFGSASNATYGCVNSYGSQTKTQGTGFSELSDGTDSPQTQWLAGNDTTVDWSGLSVAAGGIAIELKVAGAGGDVTLGLTGQALTLSRGTLTPNTSIALTGQVLASARGTLTPALSIALTGQALASALGTLTPNTSIGLAGLSATFAQGTLTVQGDVNVALTGQALTAALGSLTPNTSVALSGQALTSARGTLTADLSIPLSGQQISSATGSVTVTGGDVTLALTGQTLSIALGSLTSSGGDVASAATGAGRKAKRRYFVEIDGQQFEVANAVEAQQILGRARALAERAAEVAAQKVEAKAARAAKPRPIRLQAPKVTASPELELDLAPIRQDLIRIYDNAAALAELRVLLQRAMDEEEDETILLLM